MSQGGVGVLGGSGGASNGDALGGAEDAGGHDGAGGAGPVPYKALAVSTALAHFCALLDDHHIKCWGNNLYGELGAEHQHNVYAQDSPELIQLGTGRTVQTVSAGRHATCALLDDGSVKCWGFIEQIGLDAKDVVGDEPGEMGDGLPALQLPAGRKAVQLKLGEGVGCAVLDDDSIQCWDRKMHAPVAASGPRVVELSAGYRPLARYADGSAGDLESGERLKLPVGAHARLLAVGGMNACAIGDDGSITCREGFGLNELPPGAEALAGFTFYSLSGYCTLDKAGGVRCTTNLLDSELWSVPGSAPDAAGLLPVNLGLPAVQVSGGDYYVCALLVDGNVKCFGPEGYLGAYLVGGQIRPINLGLRSPT